MPPHATDLLVGPNGTVATTVSWATTFRSRRKGVLGREPLQAGEALIIRPCRQVHTFGVGFALDAVFCDRGLRVLHVETLEIGAVSKRVRGAKMCIEMIGGMAAANGIVPGVSLSIEASA